MRCTLQTRLLPVALIALQLFLLLAPPAADAEQTLADAEWFERQIGVGVTWRHYQFDDLYGARQSVSVIEADLSHTSVTVRFPYLPASRGRTSSFVPQQFSDAIAAVNGSYFDTSAGGGGSTTFLRMNHNVITPQTGGATNMRTEGAVTLSSGDYFRIQLRPSTGWDSYTRRRDVLANGPVLLWSGVIADFTPTGAHCSNRHPRTAVGLSSSRRLFLVTVDGRTAHAAGMTCDELARVMQELGCVSAVNMDGGGSTTMWVNGEPNNGVVNYPSDNGAYDHLGERSCSNAIAIIAPPAPPAPWDARLANVSYTKLMTSGTTQTVTLAYENIGTQRWTRTSTSLVVTRPRTRLSDFHTSHSWVTTTTPALLSEPEVAPGEIGTFSFIVTAPQVSSGRVFDQHFGLMQAGVGPFGPPDNEPRLEFVVEPTGSGSTGTYIIESRAGGLNFTRYSETGGWADSPTNCTAPGLTGNIGMRYGSTYRSIAGAKAATFRPNFAEAGAYHVYIAYGNGGSLARSPITYTVNDAASSTRYLIDQRTNHNTWVLLGTHLFNSGQNGTVTISNEDIDLSGNMYAGAVKFEPVIPSAAHDWQLYDTRCAED